jgi:hypothetical protein
MEGIALDERMLLVRDEGANESAFLVHELPRVI